MSSIFPKILSAGAFEKMAIFFKFFNFDSLKTTISFGISENDFPFP